MDSAFIWKAESISCVYFVQITFHIKSTLSPRYLHLKSALSPRYLHIKSTIPPTSLRLPPIRPPAVPYGLFIPTCYLAMI
ncbi:hypothetical protein SAMN04488055_0157 [Chitinophaga niabensis]|uniref:Uncharacterized protein n=1 Tax=Chitinophaga niabensis TaxID=536979 RepID=A0A1N6D2G5_9BACT|nr:hypothetical protein SAMN04488055_0157 [Chitinophaga niabensis]